YLDRPPASCNPCRRGYAKNLLDECVEHRECGSRKEQLPASHGDAVKLTLAATSASYRDFCPNGSAANYNGNSVHRHRRMHFKKWKQPVPRHTCSAGTAPAFPNNASDIANAIPDMPLTSMNARSCPTSCGSVGTCRNSPAGATLAPVPAATMATDVVRGTCADIDECQLNACPAGAACRNTPGNYDCQCVDRGSVRATEEPLRAPRFDGVRQQRRLCIKRHRIVHKAQEMLLANRGLLRHGSVGHASWPARVPVQSHSVPGPVAFGPPAIKWRLPLPYDEEAVRFHQRQTQRYTICSTELRIDGAASAMGNSTGGHRSSTVGSS
uniref:EGF-like domain-containing protein n=1 Tax=Macrostomum lignano TaxID=282301 RepID=A0A1I8FHR3_9PLAT